MPYERCPVCGVKVKSENLTRHMKKIHPDKEVTEKKWPPVRTSRKELIALVVLVVIIASVVSAILLWPKPDISAKPEKVELGTIAQEPRTALVTIENIGTADLEITGLRTSCACTSVVLQFEGRSSPVFAGPNPDIIWFGETLAPGESGTLEITYDPTLYGDVGQNVRYVFVKSSDPDTPELEIEIRAIVSP